MNLNYISRLFVSLFIIVVSCNAQNNSLDAGQFAEAIKMPDVQILDVRTPAEFESGHIKGALLADWNDEGEYKRRIAFVDKNKPVYVYCLAGGRSAAAAKQLRSNGYTNVYELKGGINAWRAADKPLEGASDKPEMTEEEYTNAINSNQLVLVDFGADWCPPCRKMIPVLNHLQEKYPHKFLLVKVDASKDRNLLKKYNVNALPVFILYKNGKEVWRKDGIADEKEFVAHF